MIFNIEEPKQFDKIQVNAKTEDHPVLFGKPLNAAGTILPKSYNEFTKKFDNNYLKMGLRK